MLDPFLRFESDAEEAIKSHESLKLSTLNGIVCLEGDLQLKSHEILIDTYRIRIIPTEAYPGRFPLVFEIGGRIVPNIDWHFYPDGHCCLMAPPEEIIISSKGFKLSNFIDTIVVPYFFNQKHRESFGYFLRERPHGNLGIINSLQEIVGSKDNNEVIKTIEFALKRNKVERTDYCFCGSGEKYRHCHKATIRDLSMLTDRELKSFREMLVGKF